MRSDHLVAAIQKGVSNEFDDFIRTVSKNNMLGRYSQTACDRVPEIIAATVRVELGRLNCRPHRGHCFGGGSEGIFVGGELDDLARIDTDLAGGLLDRFTGFVNSKVAQLPVGPVPDRSHAANLDRIGSRTKPTPPWGRGGD